MEHINIIFENEDLVIINKPAGLIVHSDGRTEEPSLVDWIQQHYPEAKDVGEDWRSPQGELVARPGIVHRLDRTTSGVMVIAKNEKAFATLKSEFQNRRVTKVYDALVYGHPKREYGTIEAEIGRTKKKPRKWTALPGKGGTLRAAITDWRTCALYTDSETNEPIAHLEARPKTGRTHQIRVHLKAMHHPIVCDHIYAPKKPCLLGLERPALHARLLALKLPSGEEREFEAPLPDDLREALGHLVAKPSDTGV